MRMEVGCTLDLD